MESPLSKLGKRISHLWRVKIIRFDRRIENDGITLRPYRLSDLPVLHALFDRGIFIAASGVENKVFNSSLSLWRWIINTFQMVYVIEVGINSDLQIIGFIGLYKIIIGKSLWLSAAVFNPQDRRRGYGQTALGLLLDSLQKNGIVQIVYGKVFKTNVASLGMCKKLGFEICGQNKSTFFMEKRQGSKYS